MAKSKSESPLNFVYKPRSKSQKAAEEAWTRSRIMFFLGKAGVGKTCSALGMAIRDILKGTAQGTIERPKLWLARPQVPCGEKLGYLPGDLDEKIGPWMSPFLDCFESLSNAQWPVVEKKLGVESVSVGMLRGRTIKGPGSVLIVDESQQLTRSQLVCILTRLGEGSKIVFCGDPYQSDNFHPSDSPLLDVARKLDHLDIVTTVNFTEQLRDPLISQITDALED